MLALVLAASLLPPVDGAVRRPFSGAPDPFAPGLRRGVLLAAVEGEGVRAPCSGLVRFAGDAPRGPAVTLACGRLRTTVMPVRAAVRPGSRVRRGARIGAAGGDVSLSVREPDGTYVRPELDAGLGQAPPPMRVPPIRRTPPASREPPPAGLVRAPPMPWPAWAGAALLLVAGLRLRVRSVARGRLEPARPPGAA